MVNQKDIDDFCNYLTSEGLSENRVKKYRYTLSTMSKRIGKSFRKCKKKDLVNFFADIQRSDYAENTKRDFKVVTKKFWKWLKQTEDYPEETKWIKTTMNHRLKKMIKTKDVLTEEEVYLMVDSAPHLRDKAIISLLYETGARIGEIIDLKIGDIVFDDDGYNFMSRGKTGEVYKRVVNFKAVDILRSWVESHPLRNNKDSPLWTTLRRSNRGSKAMRYRGFNKMLKETAKLSGITKNVNPHAFRHARITNLRVERGIPDAVIEDMVGWVNGSNMFKVYQHTKSKDIDKALSKSYGLKERQKEEKMIKTFDKLLAEDKEFRGKIAKLLQQKGIKV